MEETLRALDDLVRSGKVRTSPARPGKLARWWTRSVTSRHFNLDHLHRAPDHYNLLNAMLTRTLIPALLKPLT